MSNLLVLLAPIILALGIAGIIYVRRRKFYRRNVAGVEEFKSFGSAVGTRFFEEFISVISFLAILFGGWVSLRGIIAFLR